MIVQINENNSDKYRKLFTEAYEFLESLDNSPVIPGKGKFSNLAEYYGHIADLFNQQKYEYIMVPLDEEPFKIDLNTRNITVPASFSKCASVQTDTLAETIIFIADRYFDFMDLANTNIYVQWTTPDGFKGATRVDMRDLDSEPGKIKFAWPLNNLITKTPGAVKFAVRFFSITNNTEKELAYSLNTLPAEIIIKPSLQPEGPSQVEMNILDLFQKAVVNSNYAATGVNPPVQPMYSAPGTDIAIRVEEKDENGVGTGRYVINAVTSETDAVGYMKMTGMDEEKFAAGSYWVKSGEEYIKAEVFDANEIYFIQIQKGIKYVGLNNNTITLYVQAIAADQGEISYKWYYQAQDGEYNDKPYDCEVIGFGDVDHNVFINVGKNPPNVAHEVYYVQAEDGNYTNTAGLAYKEYVGTIPASVDLYERYSTLTIPADSDSNPVAVTGLYHAAAWNTIDASGYTKVDNLTEDVFDTGTYYEKVGNSYFEADSFDASEVYYAKVESYIREEDLSEDKFNQGEFYTKVGNSYVRAYEYESDKEYYRRGRGLLTTNFPTESSTCLLPGPRPIIVSKNLESQKIFGDDERIELEVAIEIDDYHPEISYDWRTSVVSEDDVFTGTDTITDDDNVRTLVIPGYVAAEVATREAFAKDIYYVLDENQKYIRATEYDEDATYYKENAGWFGVNITSKLNRKGETIPSNIIKVTHNPVPPKVVYINDPAKIFDKLVSASSVVNFEVNIDETNLDINNKLRSNSIEYIWQMSLQDQGWQTLTGKEAGIELKDNIISINSAFTPAYASFRCLVVNELNGKKAIFDHSSDFTLTDDKMGMFENNPPYIFENGQSFEFVLSNTVK